MSYIHFDEAKFEKDLRAAFAKTNADPAVHDEGSVILDRNREVSIQLAMMVCRELNRGEHIVNIASAGAMSFIEFFQNIRTYIDPADRKEFDKFVMADVTSGIVRSVAGDGSYQHGEPATMHEMQGGRA